MAMPSCRCSVGVNTRHLGLLRKVSVMVAMVFVGVMIFKLWSLPTDQGVTARNNAHQ